MKIIKKVLPLVFLLIIFLTFLHPLEGDGDFFHHINIGKYVITHHNLPQTDNLTFSAKGQPFVAYAWGAGVIFYLVYNYCGPVGINILVAFVGISTIALIYFWLKKLSMTKWLSWIILFFITPLIASRWPNRPEIFTYPFFVLLLFIDQIKKKYPKLVYFYPLIILAWANIYGSSVFIGLGTLIILAIKQFIKDKYKIAKKNRLYYLIIAVSLLISLLNGYGPKTIFYIFIVIRYVSRTQGEWNGILSILKYAPLDYILLFQYFLLMYSGYLLVFLAAIFIDIKKVRQYPFEILLATAIFLPFYAFRQLPLGVIASTPLLALLINEMEQRKKNIFTGIIIGLSIVFMTLSFWLSPPVLGQNNNNFPPNLIKFLDQNKLYGRIFNTQQIGGFLSYYLFPRDLIFSDTRDDLYVGTNVFTDIEKYVIAKQNVLPLIDKNKVNVVVADLSDGPSYQPIFYSKDWSAVFLNDQYLVAVPTKTAREKKLFVYDSIDPYSSSGIKSGADTNQAIGQYQALSKQYPDSDNIRLDLSYALFFSKQYDKAIDELSSIPDRTDPRDSLIASDRDYLLAQSYWAKNDCSDTKIYLDKTKSDISYKLFFPPRLTLPSVVNKGYSFYYLICENKHDVARFYLDLYLKNKYALGSDKTATLNQFKKLDKNGQ